MEMRPLNKFVRWSHFIFLSYLIPNAFKASMACLYPCLVALRI